MKLTLVALLLTGLVANAAEFDVSKVKYTETRLDVDKVESGSRGFIRIIGEFHNGTDQWLRNLCVDVDYLDAQGKSIPVHSINTITRAELNQGSADVICADQQYVGPGETAIFKKVRDHKNLKGTYASHRVSKPHAIVVSAPPALVIEGFKAEKKEMKNYASYAVTGTLKNTGTQTCRYPQMSVGLYTSDKKLYSVEPVVVDANMLAPGQSTPFKARAAPDPKKVVTEVRPVASCRDVSK
jgi:hypothetical protein